MGCFGVDDGGGGSGASEGAEETVGLVLREAFGREEEGTVGAEVTDPAH